LLLAPQSQQQEHTMSSLSLELDTEVLIVGAGPTGLAAAAALHRGGVTPLVVDKLAAGQNTSRAAVVHAHTLEVLEQIGVAHRLAREGIKVTKFSLRDRDSLLLRLDFANLPTPFAHLLMIPQDVTERILNESLEERGIAVQRGWALERLTERAGFVEAELETPNGMRTVRARYVIGADGMHSLVRQTAAIDFPGSRYEESFVLADVEMNWSHGRDEVMLFFSPAGLVVVAPLPGGAFRIVATLDDAPERPGVADVQALLDARGPSMGRSRVTKVLWSSRFRLHHRLAEHYRRGNLLLVGDAAHVHSPAGGQGMNTGLVDACVLGQLLADVVRGRKPEAQLDSYETLRRPAAQKVLGLAGRLTLMATLKRAPARWLRNAVLRAIGWLPKARKQFVMNLSGLSRRAAAQLEQTH
jgi:2-polyprenyl-6-methoxyphenol hydroxylase-like FAD-dependent oxidoreductase